MDLDDQLLEVGGGERHHVVTEVQVMGNEELLRSVNVLLIRALNALPHTSCPALIALPCIPRSQCTPYLYCLASHSLHDHVSLVMHSLHF